MKHRKLLALLLAVCMVLALLPTVASADEEVYYTLDGTITGGTNGYATESEITQGDFTWMVMGNTTMDPWRIGGKNLTGEDRPIYSTNPMNETITKVEVDVGTANLTSVNSISLIVASDAEFETVIDGLTLAYTANSTISFTPVEGIWSNAYYKIVFNVTAGSSNQYVQFKAARFYKGGSGDTPQPTTYTVSFDANGGTGTMANVTTASPYTLPTCGFTAPEGKEFDYWAVDGDEGMYAPGDSYTLTDNTTFIAQWKDLPVPTYTDMMLKRIPANGDVVVIYYPTAGKVMTGTDYLYNNNKHELVAADATLTDNVLAVPDEALCLTVSVDDGKYTFATADGKYLLADGTNVQLVDEQGANTLFQLETAAAGTDNWYIKCDSAVVSGKAQYIEYYSGYFSVYGLTTNTTIYTFQFFSVDGEGPTPEVTYIVSFDAGEGSGTMEDVEATNPYTLPECAFTAPEGMVFDGWMMAGGDGDIYPAGAQVTLEEPNVTFIAQWKELVARNYRLVTSDEDLVDGETYLIASELFVDELYIMSNQTSNNRAQYKLSNVEGTTITLDESWIATAAADALAFEFTLEDAEDGWAFHDEVTGGYLYAAGNETNKKNWLRTETELDDNGKFVIAFEGDDGATVPVAQGENTRGYMHYNATSDIFSCYAETSTITGAVYLYKLVEDEPAELNDGFYLIGPDWTVNAIDAMQQFGANVNAGGEYILAATLAVGDEIKVVKVADGAITAWYPDGEGTQYTVDAAHAGNVNIYFRETYNSDWSAFGGYFYIEAGYNITCVSGEHGLVSTTHSRAAEGTTVTIYLEAEDDYAVDTLTVMCDDTAVETNKVNDWEYTFTMPAGDVTITATFAIPATEPFFKSQNLILDGLIGVSFNMELPEISGVNYATSYMTFTVEHGTCTERVDYTASKTKASGTQAFVCYVNAAMMAESITATFHYTQNGTEKTVEKTYSIKEYFEAYDENQSQFDETTQALIESLADYGHYVQALLAAQKGWTLGTTFVEMDKCYTTGYNIDTITSAVEDKGITCENNGAAFSKLTFAMVFDSATELRVLLKVAKTYTGTLTATVDGTDFDVNTLGTAKAVQITNIPANLLSHPYEVEITMDGGSATITASALSYVKAMLASASSFSEPAVMQNAAAAIYSYSAAADAFKAEH